MAARTHQFYAIAFVENLSLRQLTTSYPDAKGLPYELFVQIPPDGGVYFYPFGAVVFHNVSGERREAELARLSRVRPGLTTQVVREDYTAAEDPHFATGIEGGTLRVDRMTQARASVIALTVAQSAAMEYYESVVDQLFTRTQSLVDRLEKRGTVPQRTRPLHRFIGEAVSTRTEVLSVLHLMDKPDAAWEDTAMDRIYADLRGEFDLSDRYQALESKLRSVQEALELVLDVARDRRLVLLEVAIVVLIVTELLLNLIKLGAV